jgi:hypothetical protein
MKRQRVAAFAKFVLTQNIGPSRTNYPAPVTGQVGRSLRFNTAGEDCPLACVADRLFRHEAVQS